MAVHLGSTPPPVLQGAEYLLHRFVRDTEAYKRGYLSAPTTTQVQNSPHLSRDPL